MVKFVLIFDFVYWLAKRLSDNLTSDKGRHIKACDFYMTSYIHIYVQYDIFV